MSKRFDSTSKDDENHRLGYNIDEIIQNSNAKTVNEDRIKSESFELGRNDQGV